MKCRQSVQRYAATVARLRDDEQVWRYKRITQVAVYRVLTDGLPANQSQHRSEWAENVLWAPEPMTSISKNYDK
jgi:hypothetical protein